MSRKVFYLALSVFGAAVWLFFSLAYQGHLHHIEGQTMFLYTCNYARDMILCPGGLANYIAAFLEQFYIRPWSGGLAIALVACLMALGISRLCKSASLEPLSFAVPAAYVALLCDSDWTLAGFVGLCAAVWCAVLIMKIPVLWQRITVAVLAFPLVWQLFLRAKFFDYMVGPTAIYLTLVLCTVAICLMCALLKFRKERTAVGIALYVLLFAGGVASVMNRYNALDEEIFRYENMVRTRDWDGILAYSQGKTPRSPLSTNAVNLALLMKGQLGDRMFSYYQSGPRSLVNFEEKKISSEILFLLGFTNEARHLAFEDMAGNPSRKRGVYHITRLAEFCSVGGREKALTDRYLETLRHTLFYRNYIPDSSLVTQDMEPVENFAFDSGDFNSMLALLYSQRPDNRRVREMYAASLLLNKDLYTFMEIFGSEQNPPLYHRQAIQMSEVMNNKAADPDMQAFINTFNYTGGDGRKMGRFADTYWYYAYFR